MDGWVDGDNFYDYTSIANVSTVQAGAAAINQLIQVNPLEHLSEMVDRAEAAAAYSKAAEGYSMLQSSTSSSR